jgi:hypothetical protein
MVNTRLGKGSAAMHCNSWNMVDSCTMGKPNTTLHSIVECRGDGSFPNTETLCNLWS